jgi:hypothetical protein
MLSQVRKLSLDRTLVLTLVNDSTVSGSDQDMLKKVDRSWCAQSNVRILLSNETYNQDTERSLAIVTRFEGLGDGSFYRPINAVDLRVLPIELNCLFHMLMEDRNCKEASTASGIRNKVDVDAWLIRQLTLLCKSDFPIEVRHTASKCLGEIDPEVYQSILFNDYHVISPVRPIRMGHSFSKELCLRAVYVLLSLIYQDDSYCAIIALETASCLLRNIEYSDCVDSFDDHSLHLVQHLMRAAKQQRPSLLPIQNAKLHVMAIESGCAFSDRLCWDNCLWLSGIRQDVPFEKWICTCTTAFLVNCYRSKGDSEIFTLCEQACSLDSNFASAFFPAIIVGLLTDSVHDQSLGSSVFHDTWLCEPNGQRDMLSVCFALALHAFIQQDLTSKNYDCRLTELLLDVLDLLRRQTQYRFAMSTAHTCNQGPTEPDGHSSKRISKGTPSSSVSTLDKHDTWHGVPYGVVLSLDGLVVSRACILVGRYVSALFYAEMYGDSRFLGSTSCWDVFHTEYSKTTFGSGNISGFECSFRQMNQCNATSDKHITGEDFYRCIYESFQNLGEIAGSRAALSLACDVNGENISIFNHASKSDQDYCLRSLQSLDLLATSDKRLMKNHLAVLDCVDSLGMHSTLQKYIAGILMDKRIVWSEADLRQIKEKWFETCLYNLLWFENDPNLYKHDFLSGDRPSAMFEVSQDSNIGFFQAITLTTKDILNFDSSESSSLLFDARESLHDFIRFEFAPDTNLRILFDFFDRVRTLNLLEKLVNSKTATAATLDIEHNKRLGGDEDDLPFNILEQSSSLFASQQITSLLQEILLHRIYIESKSTKTDGDSRLKSHLINHLWNVCRENAAFGRYSYAESALQRLKGLVESSSSQFTGSPLHFMIHLQQANMLESKGEIFDAVLMVKRLLRTQEDNSHTSTLALALTTCGEWIHKHKMEPADIALETYLKPGADLALSEHERAQSSLSALQASAAVLAQSDVAYKLLEVITKRVHSPEWQKQSANYGERENELKECKLLVREAATRLEGLKRKGNTKTKDYSEAEAEFRELRLYEISLARELENNRVDRDKVMTSLAKYRTIVMQSIGVALSLNSANLATCAFKYIYRFLHTWFTVADSDLPDLSLLETIEDSVAKIPSYHFVPVYSQLLSRLSGAASTKDSSDQNMLHRLLERVCVDHPYHCIIQLVAASNGRSVGAGVGGRHASTYLENLDESKVEAALRILKAVRDADSTSLGDLIDSYTAISNAYIFLALADTTSFHGVRTKNIPYSQISKLSNQRLDLCMGTGRRKRDRRPCIFTRLPPVRPGCDYIDTDGEIIGSEWIDGFESVFHITDGGLHRPKIVNCLGSKGGCIRELVKGEDEIRQDAVMQEVFGLLNRLMASRINKNEDTLPNLTRQYLKVWTYGVVPLSPASGVS